MPYPARGQHATAGFGEESTYGTEVARANWLELAAITMRRTYGTKPTARLGRLGQASNNARELVATQETVEGSISWCLSYDDSSILLLKHLLGANATTGSGPYVHTLTLASPPPTGLTIEAIPGIAGFNIAQQFTGCKLTRGTIRIQPGEEIMCEVEVIGRTSGGLESSGTPTYTSNGERIFHHSKSAGFTLGGTSIEARSCTITVDRGLEANPEIGSLLTSEPVERDRLSVTIELTVLWQRVDFHTKHFAGTQGDFTATFTSGSKSLVLTAHNCVIEDLDQPTNGAGAIEQRIRLRAYADSSASGDQGLTLAFTNGNSSHSAN